MFSASKTSGPSGYNLTNSLRFRSSASAYLSRTPATNGNLQKWTWSGWVKRGDFGVSQALFQAIQSGNTYSTLYFSSDSLRFIEDHAGTLCNKITTAKYRDPSAWYHIVLAVDTTLATAENRVIIYVNGTQVTSYSTNTTMTQNTNTIINSTSPNYIGENSVYTVGGYLAEVNFIDGQQLTPSSFGSTNATTGVWQPAKYTGTYGTNGFYLKFSDIATTSGSNAGLGKDYSGNGNYWNTNNISVTAGTTYDAMTDVPTLTSATVANYCTLNPLKNPTGTVVITNGNLNGSINTVASGYPPIGATFAPDGLKGYFEYIPTNSPDALINFYIRNGANWTASSYTDAAVYGFNSPNGQVRIAGVNSFNCTPSFNANDVGMVAFDFTGSNKNIWFGRNGTWGNNSGGSAGNPATGANPALTATNLTADAYDFMFALGRGASQPNPTIFNFGQQPFTYTPPTGFVALNTYNLPTSTIVKGNVYMNAQTYAGSASQQTLTTTIDPSTNALFWFKNRNNSGTAAWNSHFLVDSLRLYSGSTKYWQYLLSDSPQAEAANGGLVESYTSSSITKSGTAPTNESGINSVAWYWQAGSSAASSNTSGSITSTVSVNTTAGFSIVTYTGTGPGNNTVGHGLGVAPKMIITKNRSRSIYWIVYTASTGKDAFLRLNTTDASTSSANIWGTANPTSTVFGGVGTDNSNGYISGDNIVSYCWAEIAGFSKFGSYTGNGSTDGPFVYTGFRPKFLMVKRSDAAGEGWYMTDGTRGAYNLITPYLSAQEPNAEGSANMQDYLSNGFKIRGSGGYENASGGTYIYMAFAENPFKNALAR